MENATYSIKANHFVKKMTKRTKINSELETIIKHIFTNLELYNFLTNEIDLATFFKNIYLHKTKL